MDSNSDDDTFSNQIRKGHRPHRLIDSESESDSNNDSNHSALNSSTESKKSINRAKYESPTKGKRKYVLDSNTGSDDDNDSQSNSDEEGKETTVDGSLSQSVTNHSENGDVSDVTNDSSNQETDRSKNSLRVQRPTFMSSSSTPKTKSRDSGEKNDDTPDISQLNIDAEGPEIVIPDSGDEVEEESHQQCYSPRTRLSITGRRPKDLKTSDEDFLTDDEEIPASDDDDYGHRNVYLPKTAEPKRGREVLANRSLSNSITTRTPQAKRQSVAKKSSPTSSKPLINEETVDVIDSSDNEENSVVIENSDTSQLLKTINYSTKNDSVLIIESSEDEKNDIKFDASNYSTVFKALEGTSTPEVQKGLVQPKLLFHNNKPAVKSAIKKNYVSQEFYNNNLDKLEKLRNELEINKDLYLKMKNVLPDNGSNLMRRTQKLQSEVNDLVALIDSYAIEENQILSHKAEVPAPKLPSWKDIESGLNVIKPVHTGAQGLYTFNEQKAMTLERLKIMHKAMESCPTEDMLAPTPNGLKIELMTHQRHALTWMSWRERQRPRGGILADDMGLGKTLTIIALVLASEAGNAEEQDSSDDDDDDVERGDNINNMKGWMSKRKKDLYYGGTLVICPASLINQWELEVENRVKRKYLQVAMHHGNSRESSARKLSKNNIVITTYGVINSELKNTGPLFQIKWERLVLDEAHIIRNHNTNMAQSCCKLKASKRWGLTGTPVQNKEMDLYSLLKFLQCKPFDELAVFKKWINTNTEGGRDRLNNLLQPLLLRRTKLQLQDKGELQTLPTKTINIVKVTLTKDEMNVYSKILALSQTLFAQFLHQRAERHNLHDMGDFQATKKPNDIFNELHKKFSQMHANQHGEVKSSQILVLLTRLRQICDHPGLINQMLQEDDQCSGTEEEDIPDIDLMDQLNRLNLNDDPVSDKSGSDSEHLTKASSKVLMKSNPVFDFGNSSSKCRKVLELVKDVLEQTDDKIVVVSQWTSILDVIARYLQRERIYFVELNGKTPIKLRNDIVVSFNKSNSRERIMLLSLVAGGVGLNLVGANQLILLDPHWNPQLEAQAADRVYRVGQKKPVQIHKLLCENTIEERIKALQDAKISLSEHVLTGSSKSQNGSKLSLQDLRQLFDM